MTQSEAKMRILAEWRTWIGHREVSGSAVTSDVPAFFADVEKDHPEILSFEGDEDKLRLVTGWLVGAGLIKS